MAGTISIKAGTYFLFFRQGLIEFRVSTHDMNFCINDDSHALFLSEGISDLIESYTETLLGVEELVREEWQLGSPTVVCGSIQLVLAFIEHPQFR